MTAPKVLVIEDDSLLAFEMQDILSEAGYEIVGPAATVAKALRLIESQDIHAAFVDCNLQGEYATAIVQTLTARTIPFVVVTGSERESLPPEFNNGAFARKPFSAVHLLEIARTLLSGVQL
jgi:DNA-binding response OmpR family regulator